MLRRPFFPPGTRTLFGYFAGLILIGAALLSLPAAWAPTDPAAPQHLSFVDALFTSTSAVCVTGLITVNTADFSLFGQTVILVLIQLGGLGIIALTTLLLTTGGRVSLSRRAGIREFFVESVEVNPRKIVRTVVVSTLAVQAIMVVPLIFAFRGVSSPRSPLFLAVFHAVSAFCNAGFSTFRDSLESQATNLGVLLPVTLLIVTGGLGFVVHRELLRRTGRVLSLHTKIVLVSTGALLVAGTLLFAILEWNNAFAAMPPGQRLLSAVFQSVTPRTAGFNTVPQAELTSPSLFLTLGLMFVGGAPGSIAGGVKVTTMFLFFAGALATVGPEGDIAAFRRRISARRIGRAMTFVVKAIVLLAICIFLLATSETVLADKEFSFLEIVWESVSAFATVGLSLGITPELSTLGKLIIIGTMYAGRVGIVTIALGGSGATVKREPDYPTGEVLIG